MADLLRAAIDEAGLSIRELSRVLAGPDATDDRVEAWRRSLHKYLDGETKPSRPRAILIARALDKDDEHLIVARPRRRDELEDLRSELGEIREMVLELASRLPE